MKAAVELPALGFSSGSMGRSGLPRLFSWSWERESAPAQAGLQQQVTRERLPIWD